MRILSPRRLGLLSAAAISLSALTAQPMAVSAQDNPMVGGAPMMESKNIVENASKSKDHTTLVSAVKQADLVKTLSARARSQCSHRPTPPSKSSPTALSRL